MITDVKLEIITVAGFTGIQVSIQAEFFAILFERKFVFRLSVGINKLNAFGIQPEDDQMKWRKYRLGGSG